MRYYTNPMEETFLKHIEPFLKQLAPLEIQSTGAKANYSKAKGVKAVIFDIYGTLVISSSGDIMQDRYDASMFRQALQSAGFQILVPEQQLMDIYPIFEQEVLARKEKAKASGIPFPELNIVEIWEKTLKKAETFGLIAGVSGADFKLFTFVFELSSNRVWPMPGVKEMLQSLKEKGYPLGIVSNAQFYTPVMMNYFLYERIKADEFLDGFEPDLSIFSYKILKGKPDVAIYEALHEPLRLRGLQPEEVLFVGNDMLKDIYAASKAGFKTCFFAGDMRAYRLREGDQRVADVKPDFVITELGQLAEIL